MVKTIFIPAKYTQNVVLPESVICKLPKKLLLFSSVQFLDQLPRIKKQLECNKISVDLKKSKNYLYSGLESEAGQLIGCNLERFKFSDEEAVLYIGDGVFHPKALLVYNAIDIYCFNPKNSKLELLPKSLHQAYEKRRKGAILKFLSSKNIGIIITTKKGQGTDEVAFVLRDRIKEKWHDKAVYIFYCNEVDLSSLESFNFIDIFVNTACPRIGQDDHSEKPIINIVDLSKMMDEM